MYVPELTISSMQWMVSEEEDLTFSAKDPENVNTKTEGNQQKFNFRNLAETYLSEEQDALFGRKSYGWTMFDICRGT
jgi:type II secretory pathway component PulK